MRPRRNINRGVVTSLICIGVLFVTSQIRIISQSQYKSEIDADNEAFTLDFHNPKDRHQSNNTAVAVSVAVAVTTDIPTTSSSVTDKVSATPSQDDIDNVDHVDHTNSFDSNIIKGRSRSVYVVLIANQSRQQFPLLGYGGIEGWVETTAMALHRLGIKFAVITPKITRPLVSYNFTILETPNPGGLGPPSFMRDVKQIVQNLDPPPDVIWSCSNWSGEHLRDLGIPMIVNHHDSGDGSHIQVTPSPNVMNRYISQNQMTLWSHHKPWLLDENKNFGAFWLWYGFGQEEFQPTSISEKVPKTMLFVGSLSNEKGLPEFMQLATWNPDWTFIVYGPGHSNILSTAPTNVDFKGELKRGPEDQKAFAMASRFYMNVKWEEAFGRVVVEAMSKGTPVLASNIGSLPELIRGTDGDGVGVAGSISDSLIHLNASLHIDFDYDQVYNHAKKYFTAEKEISVLLSKSVELMDRVKSSQISRFLRL